MMASSSSPVMYTAVCCSGLTATSNIFCLSFCLYFVFFLYFLWCPPPCRQVQVHVLRWLVPLSPASHSRESKAAKEGGQGKVTDCRTCKVVTDQLWLLRHYWPFSLIFWLFSKAKRATTNGWEDFEMDLEWSQLLFLKKYLKRKWKFSLWKSEIKKKKTKNPTLWDYTLERNHVLDIHFCIKKSFYGFV